MNVLRSCRRWGAWLGWAAILICLAPPVWADPPSILSIFKKRTTLSADELKLRAEHGPWLVLAVTLTGEDAEQKAVRLANEIRQTMRLPAFVMEHRREESPVIGATAQLVKELDGTTTQYRAWREYANPVQGTAFAVLVGEFSTSDDPKIKPVLERIRTARPVALGGGEMAAAKAEDTSWLVQKYRSLLWSRTDRQSNQSKGPMGAAFLTRNPLLPDDFFQGPKIDEFVEGLNKQVQYSLLECPGRFTVRVASFQGNATTSLISGKLRGDQDREVSNALDVAAEQANKLTLALRKKGVEAYQFHDRYGSYVTIGSFDQLGEEVRGAGFQYHPDMIEVMRKFCGYETVDAKDPVTGAVRRVTTLKSLERIPFDPEGKPMAVPRPASRAIYRGSLMGSRG
ncbi:MAG: hypothetical protein D6753_02190 [Planctomycetota bacterium]|nr:MAG: hypothetical protein D6753_02190 [Planctomycetota bacterium]